MPSTKKTSSKGAGSKSAAAKPKAKAAPAKPKAAAAKAKPPAAKSKTATKKPAASKAATKPSAAKKTATKAATKPATATKPAAKKTAARSTAPAKKKTARIAEEAELATQAPGGADSAEETVLPGRELGIPGDDDLEALVDEENRRTETGDDVDEEDFDDEDLDEEDLDEADLDEDDDIDDADTADGAADDEHALAEDEDEDDDDEGEDDDEIDSLDADENDDDVDADEDVDVDADDDDALAAADVAAPASDEGFVGVTAPAVKFSPVSRPPEPAVGPAQFPPTNYAVVEKILVGFLGSEVRKVGLSRAVLGLSGGVDSAVSAAIAARALGPENVLGVMMPYQSSSPESLEDAIAVAESLGIETMRVEITEQVDAYFERFPDASRLRRGNKMARERMTILYDHSAARSALVVGTSNKTELLLGYGTLYGDMASALNPIGDLYKTQVWGLARHLALPAAVIEKAPTADLWTGQTDEHELGFSYHEVDRLLYWMIDERCSFDELEAMGFQREFVERIARMVRGSQFKRRLPIIAKISARTVDPDFRYSRDLGL